MVAAWLAGLLLSSAVAGLHHVPIAVADLDSGPAYLALFVRGQAPEAPGLPDYLFFGPRNASPRRPA